MLTGKNDINTWEYCLMRYGKKYYFLEAQKSAIYKANSSF